ncbi:MAG: hypothetical protein WAV26_01355 [Candidatus Deferrimicrobium sp.]
MNRPYLLALLLGVAAVYFGAQTNRAMDGPFPPPPVAAGAAPAAVGSPAPAGTVGRSEPSDASSSVAVVSARPLFRVDRRPYRELPPPQRNFAAELSRIRLVGVMSDGGALYGLVAASNGARTERLELRPGDAVAGFVVKEVQLDGLLLEADHQRFPLPLFSGAPTPAQRMRTELTAKPAAPSPPASPPGAVAPVNQKGIPPGRPK